MKFVDLNAQFRALEPQIRAAIDQVLAHGQFIMGPEVFEFEAELAAFTGVQHAVSCASGTDALLMALMSEAVGPGDAVFTSPFTFFATAEVIALLGATPVFVDIEPDTFNIDASRLADAITRTTRDGKLRPRGIIPVDLFGLPADYATINSLAAKHGLFVLEDAAQSFGATCEGRRAGALAPLAATSFFPAKTLGAYGDGGAVFTDDDGTAERLRSIRIHGQGVHQYDNVRLGVTGRLDTLQAAILRCKLAVFPAELAARERVAAMYRQQLGNAVQLQRVPAGMKSAWGYFSITSERRDAIRAHLQAELIPSALYYPKPLHLQPAFASLGYRVGDFEVAERAAREILSLPMHPYLQDAEIERIAQAVLAVAHN